MKLLTFRSEVAVHVEGEALAATTAFAVGSSHVDSIEATPVGVVIRRNRRPELLNDHVRQLADVVITCGGWAVCEKLPAQPAQLRKK